MKHECINLICSIALTIMRRLLCVERTSRAATADPVNAVMEVAAHGANAVACKTAAMARTSDSNSFIMVQLCQGVAVLQKVPWYCLGGCWYERNCTYLK